VAAQQSGSVFKCLPLILRPTHSNYKLAVGNWQLATSNLRLASKKKLNSKSKWPSVEGSRLIIFWLDLLNFGTFISQTFGQMMKNLIKTSPEIANNYS